MSERRAFTLIELIIIVTVLVAVVVGMAVAGSYVRAAADRAECERNVRVVGVAMMQYAGDHDDSFMTLPGGSGDCASNFAGMIVPEGMCSRSGFAVLFYDGYLRTTKVLICPSSSDRLDPMFTLEFRQTCLAFISRDITDSNCSYGWDPTKSHSVDACCAILADKLRKVPGLPGSAANNSENHGGKGQNVFYNDGQVRWQRTPVGDNGIDPDIYAGGPGYEVSNTDAKIIR